MEMERINNRMIHVIITNDDLEERNISLMELLDDHQKIENFFYKILDEVDLERDFADDDQVTFQIMPNRNGIELFISKMTEDELEHMNFDEVLSNLNAERQSMAAKADEEITRDLQGLDEANQIERVTDVGAAASDETADDSVSHQLVIALSNFDAMIQLAKTLASKGIRSSLYEYDKNFYLVLQFAENRFSNQTITELQGLALEFGQVIGHETGVDLLSQHANLLIQDKALATVKKEFK